jgi:hypothetical protein
MGAAPVAARAGGDRHLLAAWITVQEPNPGQVRQVASSVFHHLHELDAVFLDHQAVDLHHLRGGDIRHMLNTIWDGH